jgi:hypothetical protein
MPVFPSCPMGLGMTLAALGIGSGSLFAWIIVMANQTTVNAPHSSMVYYKTVSKVTWGLFPVTISTKRISSGIINDISSIKKQVSVRYGISVAGITIAHILSGKKTMGCQKASSQMILRFLDVGMADPALHGYLTSAMAVHTYTHWGSGIKIRPHHFVSVINCRSGVNSFEYLLPVYYISMAGDTLDLFVCMGLMGNNQISGRSSISGIAVTLQTDSIFYPDLTQEKIRRLLVGKVNVNLPGNLTQISFAQLIPLDMTAVTAKPCMTGGISGFKVSAAIVATCTKLIGLSILNAPVAQVYSNTQDNQKDCQLNNGLLNNDLLNWDFELRFSFIYRQITHYRLLSPSSSPANLLLPFNSPWTTSSFPPLNTYVQDICIKPRKYALVSPWASNCK